MTSKPISGIHASTQGVVSVYKLYEQLVNMLRILQHLMTCIHFTLLEALNLYRQFDSISTLEYRLIIKFQPHPYLFYVRLQ